MTTFENPERLYDEAFDLYQDDNFQAAAIGYAKMREAARSEGNADAAMRAVHDLKSEAGTLGMHRLQQAAAALETACGDGSPDADIEDLTRGVAAELDQVIDELGALVAGRGKTEPALDKLPARRLTR